MLLFILVFALTVAVAFYAAKELMQLLFWGMRVAATKGMEPGNQE